MGLQQMMMRLAPRFVARWFASPYSAGEQPADALAEVDRLHTTHGICSTIDLLGEYIKTRAEVDAEMKLYRELLPQLAARPWSYPSVKLSALGQSVDESLCRQNAEELVRTARDINQFIAFDMEDHTTVDSTLGIYRHLRDAGYDNIGIVLQARLLRTPADIDALKDYKPVVRLCIGIYQEPPRVAVTKKPEMKARMIEQLQQMIEHGMHPCVATHDEAVIAKARQLLIDKAVPKDRCEFQMLLGVPRAPLQTQLVAEGWTVRLYVPYGENWYPYSMRRLAESPDIFGHVLRNTFSRKGRL
ncbi:MAG: proline dehydrogenase family protein [Planctomycetota bacterium]